MIVTAWVIQDHHETERSIRRVVYKGQSDTRTPEQFRAAIQQRIVDANSMARVEFGPVSETGWGK